MTVTPETLLQWAYKIDCRLAPISAADAHQAAVLLREAARAIATRYPA
jgi:hypothetical protein